MLTDRLYRRLSALASPKAIVAAGVALRLATFAFTELPEALAKRPELAPPTTSFRSLREGVFIYANGSNPYEGGVFYQSPLYLAVFTYFVPISSTIATSLLWSLVDAVGSWALIGIWRSRQSVAPSENRDSLVAAIYLFNPYTLMTCLARSTIALDNIFVLLAIRFAAQGASIYALVCLALATHASLYPGLLLPAMIMLLAKKPRTQSAVANVATYAASVGGFTALNYAIAGWTWISRSWGTIISVPDLTPNVGMWWYFVTEMFDHFRPFFVGVFHLSNLIYVAPLCLRLRHDPLLAMMIMTGIFGTWKSYPGLGDLGLWAGLLSCFPDVVSNLRHPLFTLTVYLYTLILLPLLHSLWLLTGTGNANFFYAATMVHGLNSSLAIADVLGASVRNQVKQDAIRAGQKWDDSRHQVVQLNKADL